MIKAAEIVRRLAEHRPETRITDSWRRWVEGQAYDAELKALLTDADRLWDALPDASAARSLHARTRARTRPTRRR